MCWQVSLVDLLRQFTLNTKIIGFFFIEFSLSLLRGTLSERLNSYLYFKTVCIQINYTLFGDQYRIIFGVYNQ